MSTHVWGVPQNIGPTAGEWKRVLSEIASLEFDVGLNVVSSLRAFLRGAANEKSVRTLYSALVTSGEAREEVLGRISDLSRLEVDRRYENPHDTALAVLLWLTVMASPDFGTIAADLADRAPQCWYAKKLARIVLAPNPIESGDMGRAAIASEFSLTSRPPSERTVTLNPAFYSRCRFRTRSEAWPTNAGSALLEVAT